MKFETVELQDLATAKCVVPATLHYHEDLEVHLRFIDGVDESPSGADSSVLVKALQRIAKGDTDCEDCDSAFQFITEIAANALAQFNAVEPEKDQDDAFIKKHVAIIKEKILENSIQIKMQHLQRPPMDASVKYFLEKGTVSGNFMLAIKDIIFGLPKMIQEELMAQTPRTPISQPGELDTVGEHPSDKEGEGKDLGECQDCQKRPATKDYNGHGYFVCDPCYKSLSNEFDEEYK